MKKITSLFTMLSLMIGTLNLNAQTIIIDQTFDLDYANSTANGKTAWAPNTTMVPSDYADGFGFINATNWSTNPTASPCSWTQGFLTLGSPQNRNTEEDCWFTYTVSGLTVGYEYKVDIPVTRSQGRVDVGHTLDAWSTTPPPIDNDYAVTNSIYTTTTGNAEALQNLTKTFTANATTMTFGLGIGRVASNLFNKTRIHSFKLTEMATLSTDSKDLIENNFTVSKNGVSLKTVSGNVQIIDLLGRELASKALKAQEILNYKFNSATIYIVKLSTNLGSVTRKIVFN